jgi:pyrroloquinoline quinone (PQQ) biosynthesis protein C
MDYICRLNSESEAFVLALDQCQLVGGVISGMVTPEEYISFLVGTYQYVRWSGCLLAQTALGLRRTGRCPELVRAIEDKAAEEGPHDGMLLRDLRRLGQDVELIKGRPAPQAVRAYVSFGLSLAEASSPAFLGAAYTLEYISMRRAGVAARELRRMGSVTNVHQALSFLDSHGVADVRHIAELEALLATISDPDDQNDILLSARVLRRLYPDFFELPREPGRVSCSA